MTSAITLIKNIEQWHHNRNMVAGSTPAQQMLKLTEEFGELASSLARFNKDKRKYHAEAMDALGDMFVVMSAIALMLDVTIEECIAGAYEEIKDRKGKMVDGIFIKENEK